MTDIGEIALYFIYIRDQLKIYHWQTKNYARHVASDSFVSSLSDKMDKFMEVAQGKSGSRMVLAQNNFSFKNQDDISIVNLLQIFKEWLLNDLSSHLNPIKDSDLINIRDDILIDLNQTLYLFTFQ